jgi:hypothetical protein
MPNLPQTPQRLAVVLLAAAALAGCRTEQSCSTNVRTAPAQTPHSRVDVHSPRFSFSEHRVRTPDGEQFADAKSPPHAGYTRGIAQSYRLIRARLHATPRDEWVAALVAPPRGSNPGDLFARYGSKFRNLGLNVATNEEDRLRALYLTLYEMGVRESDGEYYLGVDTGSNKDEDARRRLESNDPKDAEQVALETEAGLFQSSWDFVSSNPRAARLFRAFQAGSRRDDLLEVFREGYPAPPPAQNPDLGRGAGVAFQALAKRAPNFALECAALTLRQPGVDDYYFLHYGMMDFRPEVLSWLRTLE